MTQVKKKLLLRSLFYSISIVFFLLLIWNGEIEGYSSKLLLLISIGGFILLITESFFTTYYANSIFKHKKHLSKYNFFHHGINHMIYPLISYCAITTSIIWQDSIVLSLILIIIGFILLFINFFLVPGHLAHHRESKDTPWFFKNTSVDFIMHIFKFFSYFLVHLALFEGLTYSYIEDITLIFGESNFFIKKFDIFFLINFIVNFLYLFLHINREGKTTTYNKFIAVLFSFITSLFIIISVSGIYSYSASLATIIFYLSSSIFCHKIDGTINTRLAIEYASLATILSVFLFS